MLGVGIYVSFMILTGSTMLVKSRIGADPVLFAANHPFLFMITAGIGFESNKNYPNDTIVFMGKVTSPDPYVQE